MILEKVISGGQTGADQAGLVSAALCNIPTGGWISKGFRTELGNEPSLARFGLQETESSDYPTRTMKNVHESDGTVRIAFDFNSAGERLTRNLCIDAQKPYFDVAVFEGGAWVSDPEDLAQWIIKHKIKVLNVAGNRETTCPGLHQQAILHLMRVFQLVKEKS